MLSSTFFHKPHKWQQHLSKHYLTFLIYVIVNKFPLQDIVYLRVFTKAFLAFSFSRVLKSMYCIVALDVNFHLTVSVLFPLSVMVFVLQLCSHSGLLLLKWSATGLRFNGAESNCRIAHILGTHDIFSNILVACAVPIWKLHQKEITLVISLYETCTNSRLFPLEVLSYIKFWFFIWMFDWARLFISYGNCLSFNELSSCCYKNDCSFLHCKHHTGTVVS